MGKGDKRSFRGKIVMGSYGKHRPRKPTTNTEAPIMATPTPETVKEKDKKEKPATKTKATTKKTATTKDEAAPKKKVVKKTKPKEKETEE